jgi:hypothetical protein
MWTEIQNMEMRHAQLMTVEAIQTAYGDCTSSGEARQKGDEDIKDIGQQHTSSNRSWL